MAEASLTGWLEIAGGLITVAGAAAGAAIFFTRSVFEAQQERLKADLAATEKERAAIEARYRQLLEAGNLVSTMMQGIEDEFAQMADRVRATAGSIFVPAPSYIPNESPSELVFFNCFGGANLKGERIPIAETEAGRAFSTEFIKDPDNLRKIGITPRERAAQATILFADISNSSRLMRSLDTAQVIDMYNQYFEELCEVALRFGGTVDQFFGGWFHDYFQRQARCRGP